MRSGSPVVAGKPKELPIKDYGCHKFRRLRNGRKRIGSRP